MPRLSAALRSRLSLVHRSVDGLMKTEAYQVCVDQTMPRLYKRRASIIRRTSLSCATCTWGKRSSSASVLWSLLQGTQRKFRNDGRNGSQFALRSDAFSFPCFPNESGQSNRSIRENQFVPACGENILQFGMVPSRDANRRRSPVQRGP